MSIGYVFMLAGLVSFGLLGVFHKVADVKDCRPSAINAMLYAWSLVFSVVTVLSINRSVTAPVNVLWIALPFGVSASVAILAFQAGIRHGNIATSWLAINLSSAIPTVASIVIYHEPLGLRKTIALLLIPVSIALLWIDKRREPEGAETHGAPEGVLSARDE